MCAAVLFLLLLVNIHAQDIPDLGVVSSRRAIVLEKDTNQVDFAHFHIDLVAQRWPSNTYSFVTTNTLLKLEDFMPMPPGLCIMGVKAVYHDGDESNISLYRVHVRRDAPKPPRAQGIGILSTNGPVSSQTTTGMLHHYFHSRTNRQSLSAPPMPPGMSRQPAPDQGLSRERVRAMAMAVEAVHSLTNLDYVSTTVDFPGPLPGGSPKTYSDHMVEMHDFMTRAADGRRRSQ